MKRVLASLIIVVPLAASAQTSPQGITVTGNGSASAVVSSAIVRVSMNRFAGDDGSYMVSRLKAAGVADAVAEPTMAGGPQLIVVHGHLTGLTKAKLDAVTRAASQFGSNVPPQFAALVALSGVHYYGLATDCPAIEQRAREAALADARRRAEAIAANGAVHLGERLTVVESGGCPRAGPFGGTFAIDTDTLSMSVPVSETVTYALTR
jgi:uncharacterized protein YggE